MVKQNQYEKGLKLAEEVLKESQELGISFQEVDSINTMVEILWRLGRFDECLALIEQGEKILHNLPKEKEELAEIDQKIATLLFHKGIIHYFKGNMDQALKYSQKSLIIRKHVGNKHLIAISLNSIGNILEQKGDLDQAMEYHQKSLVLRREIGNKKDIAASLNNIGNINWQKGDLDQALEFYQQSLTLHEELGLKQGIANTLNNIGLVHEKKGNLSQALEYLQQSLELKRQLGHKVGVAWTLLNIGIVYTQKGNLNHALEYLQQSFALNTDIGDKIRTATSLYRIGIVYRLKGDLDQCLDYSEKSLTIREEIGNSIYISKSLLSLVSIAIEKKNLEQARKFVEQLRQINKKEDNKAIDQRWKIGEAMLLKTHSRMKDKLKAQEIYLQIVEEDIIDHELTIIAMLSLCELLINEFKAFGETEVLQEIKNYIHKLYALAKEQNSLPLIIDTLILQARFAMIDGNLSIALSFLENAEETAEKKELGQFIEKVSYEKQQLEEQYDIWQELIHSNTPFQIRLEQARLSEYIKAAQRMMNIRE